MAGKRLLFVLGLVGIVSVAGGAVVYAITREFSVIPLSLVWGGLLSLLIFFYVNFTEIRAFVSKRSTKHGANMAVMITIFVAIIGLIGVMSVRYKIRVDLTETGRYSLSQQSVKILKSLENDVEAVAFYRSDERSRQAMHDLLKEYSYHTTRFRFWFVDPDKRPIEAAKYGVTSYRTTLIRSRGKQEIVGYESEEKVTNALLRVIGDEVKIIYFLKGHGEKSLQDDREAGYKSAREAIEKEAYEVRELLLVNEERVPEDAAILVVAGPQKDILPAELVKIRRYVDGGGSVLFLLDPLLTPEISKILQDYGFKIGNDIIIDKQSKMLGANYLTPVVMEYNQKHTIGRDFSFVTFFPVARSVAVQEDPVRGRYNLAETGSSSWAKSKGKLDEEEIEFNPTEDQRGPINLAAVSVIKVEDGENRPLAEIDERGDAGAPTPKSDLEEGVNRWGRIIVVGDSDFASNAYLNLMGNMDFFLNMIGWLAEEAALVSVRKKPAELTPLTLTDTQTNLVFWLCVVLAPASMLAIGVGVVGRRRWMS
ncbi:MAG: GldG family protein [Alphaproteobacteria bacterium]|nr:GldG family protein [Alphaproteobacteria bacterium]